MRTTLTLDDDVARMVEEAVHREHSTTKQVVNDALRRALRPRTRREPYQLVPHESAVKAGFDLAGFNRLVDELEDEAAMHRTQHPS